MKKLSLLMIILAFLTGCYTGYEEAVTNDEVDQARLQAIQDSLARVNEKQIKIYRSFAHDYYNKHQFARARDYFVKQLDLDVSHKYSSDYAQLADCYIHLNQADSAQIAYETGLKYKPDNVYLHFALGLMLYGRSQFSQALEHFRFVTGHEPANPRYLDAWIKMKEIYLGEEDYDAVLEVLDQLIKNYPDRREYVQEKESILAQYFDPEELIASLEKSHAAYPEDRDLTLKLARAYFDNTQYDRALALATELLEGETTPELLDFKAGCLENLEQYGKAVATLKQLWKMDQGNPEVLCRIAGLYLEQKQFPKARSYVRKARRVAPDCAHATYLLGQIYETAADECIGSAGIKFDDRLIFKMAREEFQKITNDPKWGKKARSKVKYLAEYIPQKQDLFMHQGQTQAKKPCYAWIYE